MHKNGRGTIQNYQEARRLYVLDSAQGLDNAPKYPKIHPDCPLLGSQMAVTRTSWKGLNGRIGVAASFDHTRGPAAGVAMRWR